MDWLVICEFCEGKGEIEYTLYDQRCPVLFRPKKDKKTCPMCGGECYIRNPKDQAGYSWIEDPVDKKCVEWGI